MSEQRKREFDQRPLLWQTANAVAAVAAIFSLIVCILLIADYVRIRKIDPVNQPQLEALRQRLALSTDNNDELISQIRAFDLMARRALFESYDQRRTGGFLLLGGVLVLSLSLKLATRWRPALPRPHPETQDESELNAHLRQLLIGAGIFLVVISLFLAFTVQSNLIRPKLKPLGKHAEIDIAWRDMQTNWPSFRGPGGYGVANFTNAPTHWNIKTGKGVLWKTDLPAQGYNSPIVWGKHIFLSGSGEDGEAIYCFNSNTGKLLWHHATEQNPSLKRPKVTEDTGYAAPTMTTDGRRVFAIFGTGDLVCCDFDGNPVWQKNIGIPKNPYGHASSLIILGKLLYVQFDQEEGGGLHAFNTATGKQVWRVARKNISWSSPALIPSKFGMQLILNSTEDVDAYDPATGKLLWTAKCLGGEVAPSPAYANGVIYVANEYAEATALKLLPGKAKTLWQYNEHLPDIASPLASKDHLFIITSAGDAVCLENANAKELWVHEFYKEFKSSPILVGKRIYSADLDGTIWIFKAGPKFELINSIKMGEAIFATPAFMDGRIYIKTEKSLYCVGHTK